MPKDEGEQTHIWRAVIASYVTSPSHPLTRSPPLPHSHAPMHLPKVEYGILGAIIEDYITSPPLSLSHAPLQFSTFYSSA